MSYSDKISATKLFTIHKPESIVGFLKFVRLHKGPRFIAAPFLAARLIVAVSNPSLKTPICLRFHGCTVAKWRRQFERTNATRIPQITVKNGRPKLPRVFLMLLTLITSELDPALSLFSLFLRRQENPQFFSCDLISTDTPFLEEKCPDCHILFRQQSRKKSEYKNLATFKRIKSLIIKIYICNYIETIRKFQKIQK